MKKFITPKKVMIPQKKQYFKELNDHNKKYGGIHFSKEKKRLTKESAEKVIDSATRLDEAKKNYKTTKEKWTDDGSLANQGKKRIENAMKAGVSAVAMAGIASVAVKNLHDNGHEETARTLYKFAKTPITLLTGYSVAQAVGGTMEYGVGTITHQPNYRSRPKTK